jgi:(1->4)-alpha-D-glucan 1-alpha-D-glucosylmutase
VAEKILSAGAAHQRDWRIAGSTGYGFLNAVAGLFVHPRHVRQLRRAYARITGRTAEFEEVAYQSRITIMMTSMASELNVLAHALNRISETDRRSRDFTLNSCRSVLREVTACFPVYRTYISSRGISDFDRRVLDRAIAEARRRNPVMEASIFEFLREVLVSRSAPAQASATPITDQRLRFAMQMQQFTAPVQAKGIEDTAFYRYHVLMSANDVGGHPGLPSARRSFTRRTAAGWPTGRSNCWRRPLTIRSEERTHERESACCRKSPTNGARLSPHGCASTAGIGRGLTANGHPTGTTSTSSTRH